MGIDKIISLLRSRDQRGLTGLYDMYGQAVFGIISRMIDDRQLAEEVLQKTMLKAWDRFDTYDDDKSSIFTWLSVIARHSAIDVIRLKSYQNRKKTDSVDEHVYPLKVNHIDENAIDVQKLLGTLEPKYKILIDKMYLQGYSQRDISEEMQIPLGTVKTRLRQAIKNLRTELQSERVLFMGFFTILLVIIWWLWQ